MSAASYPAIGIRPLIDGRRRGVRESLEDKTAQLAKDVAELISSRLTYPDGSPVRCVVSETAIGGVAEANRLPSLNLSSFLGTAAASTSDLFSDVARTWGVGASVMGPLFDFGRSQSGVESAEALAEQAEALGRESQGALAVDILDEEALEALGAHSLLSVGRGSREPSRLIVMKYQGAEDADEAPHVLIGKGITFDTGGISLKPGSGMWDMISDMGGSAAMAASIIAAAKLNLPVKITATLPLAENMPGSDATRPGDVITHYGGITSEVLNTDAEGRLVLADAIARASEDNPDYLIETATLTGAQMVALGERTAGVMGSEEFRDRMAEIGREVGEKAWAMPLLEEHEESVKSASADIRNINAKREGGMEYAGTYLQHFVGEGIEWAHIDVAGPSFNTTGAYGYTPKMGTGVPTRTVVAALREIAESK